MAYEIGHNLGLPHIVESRNLMQLIGSGERLNSDQISTTRSSRFAQEIPLFDPGDFDGDGDIDGIDFLEWQRGNSPTPGSANDLAAWQAGYGALPLAVSTSVPEPATCVQLMLLFLSSATTDRGRRALHLTRLGSPEI